jgi:hypothetical protein
VEEAHRHRYVLLRPQLKGIFTKYMGAQTRQKRRSAIFQLQTDDRDVRSWAEGEAIDIPVALIKLADGRSLETLIAAGEQVVVEMDWKEAIPHPDDRVEWVSASYSKVVCKLNPNWLSGCGRLAGCLWLDLEERLE